MTHWAFAYHDEASLRKAMRARLVELVPEGPGMLIEKRHEGIPDHFQEKYPTFVLSSIGARSQHRSVEWMPQELLFNARAIDILIGASQPGKEEQGKRAIAEDTCMEIMSQFKLALSRDSDFDGRIRMGTSEASSFNRAAEPRLDRFGNLLWVESLEFGILL